jgi:hypothetical protein
MIDYKVSVRKSRSYFLISSIFHEAGIKDNLEL